MRVAHVKERKFLGHRLFGGGGLGIAPMSIERFKEKVRKITRRNRGVKLENAGRGFELADTGLGELLPPQLPAKGSSNGLDEVDSSKSAVLTGRNNANGRGRSTNSCASGG